MQELDDQRNNLRNRIGEHQRRATQLSILLKIDAQQENNIALLEETAERLESAVGELEQARRVLVSA